MSMRNGSARAARSLAANQTRSSLRHSTYTSRKTRWDATKAPLPKLESRVEPEAWRDFMKMSVKGRPRVCKT